MKRYRITVRGLGLELRGYMDQGLDEGQPSLAYFAEQMEPFGVVVASEAPSDLAPHDPDGDAPTPEKSVEVMRQKAAESASIEQFIMEAAWLHFMQAMVIRGERDQREGMEREMRERELHHFETEQENERLKEDHTESEKALIDEVNRLSDLTEEPVAERAQRILDNAVREEPLHFHGDQPCYENHGVG